MLHSAFTTSAAIFSAASSAKAGVQREQTFSGKVTVLRPKRSDTTLGAGVGPEDGGVGGRRSRGMDAGKTGGRHGLLEPRRHRRAPERRASVVRARALGKHAWIAPGA